MDKGSQAKYRPNDMQNASVNDVKVEKYTFMQLNGDLFQQDIAVDDENYADMLNELQKRNEDMVFGGDESDFHHKEDEIPPTEPEFALRKQVTDRIRVLAIDSKRVIKVLKCDKERVRAKHYGIIEGYGMGKHGPDKLNSTLQNQLAFHVIMEMEPDIENMTLEEYLRYESKKESRLWKSVRSKGRTTGYKKGYDDSFYNRNESLMRKGHHDQRDKISVTMANGTEISQL
nr:hypothetical protein [Tanacetum cinerariifolium]